MSNIQSASNLRRIDVHHHLIPPGISKVKISLEVGWTVPPDNIHWTPELSLKAMDALGIQTAILSTVVNLPVGPPGPENCQAAREYNEYAAKVSQQYPDRFGFYGCLPDPKYTKGALEEIRYALDHLHADGISMASSYGDGADGVYVGDDSFTPIWEELNRREAIVFLHGQQTPSSTPYPGPFLGIPITEVPNETFKAASHLVVTGKKRRYPKVKIILSHLGGSMPFIAPRVAVLSRHMGSPLTSEEILEDFKTFYFDTALSGYEAPLTLMKTFVDPSRLLYGSDFPAVSTEMVDWYNKHLEEFSAKSDGGNFDDTLLSNAKTLFPRFA
ncbi:hypothetical protein C8Q75DRAFT_729577 [Abortiporus biennis]|nr:hypothetical protein C8Q75DRAFT_729577 [Abortiporus biennis]